MRSLGFLDFASILSFATNFLSDLGQAPFCWFLIPEAVASQGRYDVPAFELSYKWPESIS